MDLMGSATSWRDSKRWSDRFLPEIKQILGLYLIGAAPVEEDTKRNTDLIVLKMAPVRIACRVRRYFYLEKYSNEFTFRCDLPSGVKTELEKIMDGWGDYFFYAFAAQDETCLARWTLCRLDSFRWWFRQRSEFNHGMMPGKQRSNTDGTKFRSYCYAELPPYFVVASNWTVWQKGQGVKRWHDPKNRQ